MIRLSLLMVTLASIFSCSEPDLDFSGNLGDVAEVNDQFVVLGKKKAIPFTLQNMQKAYESILQNPTASQYPKDFLRKTTGGYQIETTHHYVKFHPQDSIQYETIANDSILAVSDIPFEYDVETDGSRFQDPELIGTDFTYYYSVVKVGHELPANVPYEIVSDLHFTPEDLIDENASEQELQEVDFFNDLNTEALKQADALELEEKKELLYFDPESAVEESLPWQEVIDRGLELKDVVINFNEDDYEPQAKFFRRRRWNPSGTITVREDAINQTIGVAGAQVRVRKWGWLVIKRAYTNTSGYFRTSSTRTKRVKYSVYFKDRSDFTVKAGTWFWNARHRGHRTYKRRPWNQHFSGGRAHLYSLVQNAAYDYFRRVIHVYGLRKPRTRMKISAKYNLCATSQHRAAILTWLPISRIRITRRDGNCTVKESDRLYASTIHELAHASHQKMDPGMFSIFHQNSCNRAFLIESWADGVETIVTNDRYSSLDTNYFNHTNDNIGINFQKQRQRVFEMTEYTPLVEDLVDNYNQAVEYSFLNPDPPIDRVRGYDLNQIQNAVNNCRTIDCWENNLRIYYFNTTENNLTELFDYVRAARNNENPNRCN